MSSTDVSRSAVDTRAGVLLPAYARAAIYSVAWLPALVVVAFFVPKFEDLFSVLRERAELPAVTAWLLWFARLDNALFFLPSVFVLVLLISADIGVASLLQGSARQRRYWIWFGGVVVTGIVAVVIVTTALLLPFLKMSASI